MASSNWQPTILPAEHETHDSIVMNTVLALLCNRILFIVTFIHSKNFTSNFSDQTEDGDFAGEDFG